MKQNVKKLTVLLSASVSAMSMFAGTNDVNKDADEARGDGVIRESAQKKQIDKTEIERCRKAAEAGDVEAQEMMGWVYYDAEASSKDKAEAVKWWCKVGGRGSEMMRATLRLMFAGEERGLIYNAAGEMAAAGGRSLPDSSDPLAFRVECSRRAYIDKWLGFSEQTWKPFPALAAVTNSTGLKLDFAERLATAVKGKTALFPDGGIHWTEDGANGLSFADTDVKIREAQIKCVREMMTGRKTANKAGTSWIINDDFTFGYLPWHDMGDKDTELYVFSLRHELNGKPPKACVLIAFAPTQLMSDSILGALLGNETAKANLKALEKAGIVIIMGD